MFMNKTMNELQIRIYCFGAKKLVGIFAKFAENNREHQNKQRITYGQY